LDRLADETPDLILLDLMMPVMDGFEFMSRLRDDDRYAEVPVVVLTAKELTADEKELLESQTQKLIVKGPHHREELLRFIRRSVTASHSPRKPAGVSPV
jgi:CheY-like chemotaxis protein